MAVGAGAGSVIAALKANGGPADVLVVDSSADALESLRRQYGAPSTVGNQTGVWCTACCACAVRNMKALYVPLTLCWFCAHIVCLCT